MLVTIWNVLYPIVLYYVVAGFAFFGMTILFGEQPEIYMLKQLVSSAVTIPFLWTLWKQEKYVEEVVYGKPEKKSHGKYYLTILFIILGTACVGVSINNFIAMTPLIEKSTGFQVANESFFTGNISIRIAASCFVVPIAEELLFRGVVFNRATKMTDRKWAIIFSAFLFGIVHVNLVQFLYATLLGVVLSVIVVKTRKISPAILAHGMTNLVAILRTETGFLDFAYQPNFAGITVSVLLLVSGCVMLYAAFINT